MRKNARKPVDCPICKEPFMRPRPEQLYCSTSCGHQARSQRAMEAKEQNGKRCSVCHETKPLSEFDKNAAIYDGYKQHCKACSSVVRKERMERVMADPDRLARYRLQQQRAGRVAYARALSMETTGTVEEWMQRLSDPNRKRCMTHEEQRQVENEAAWLKYWEDPEHRKRKLQKNRASHEARPWVMLTRKHRRDALLAGVRDDGSVTVEALMNLWESSTTCLYCGRELNQWNKSIEHMSPLSKGGDHAMSNVIIACRLCNATKGSMSFDCWLERIREPFRQAAHDRFVADYIHGS